MPGNCDPILKMVLFPSAPKDSGAGHALAFVMVRAIPRETIIMPSVAMNGGSFNLVIRSPLARPQATPTSRPMSMLIQIGTPAIADITATVPVRAMTDPMERSIPPVIMAKVTPMPMRVVVLVCSARVRMLRMVKKFFAVIEKLGRKVTMFHPDGNPARATLSVSFKEYRTLREQLLEPRRESADKSKRRVVVGRDQLWQIAAREYDDVNEWRRIAEANDLDDPRDIEPGDWLLLPPMENPNGTGSAR